MPWPMVHLAVADVVMPQPSASFLLGSLAPDSVHVRTNERSEKVKTHLMVVEGQFLTDADLYTVFQTNKKRANADSEFLQYLLGYIAHIYTDRRWTFEVYPDYEAHPDGRSQYHREVEKIEFMLLNGKPDGYEWLDRLKQGTAYDFGGLSAEEVYAYREMKLLGLAAEPEENAKHALMIMSPERLECFIEEVGQSLRLLFAEWGVGYAVI